MIPPKGRVRTSKGHWKPSMSESEESLVAHVKVYISEIHFFLYTEIKVANFTKFVNSIKFLQFKYLCI